MDFISDIVGSILLYVNRTVHRLDCASECCNNRSECINEVESSSEEVSAPPQYEQDPE